MELLRFGLPPRTDTPPASRSCFHAAATPAAAGREHRHLTSPAAKATRNACVCWRRRCNERLPLLMSSSHCSPAVVAPTLHHSSTCVISDTTFTPTSFAAPNCTSIVAPAPSAAFKTILMRTGYCSAMLLLAFPLKTCHPCTKINAHSSHTHFATPAFRLMMLEAQCTPRSTADHMPRLSCPQKPIDSRDGVPRSLSIP